MIPSLTARYVPTLNEPTIAALHDRTIVFTDGKILTARKLPDWFDVRLVEDWTFPSDGSVCDGIRVTSRLAPDHGATLCFDVDQADKNATLAEYDDVMAWMCQVEQRRATARKRARR